MARSLGALNKAEKVATEQAKATEAALAGVGAAAARAGAQAAKGAAGMGAMARAMKSAQTNRSMGNLIKTKYTKSGISGASSALGGAAMQGPVLNRKAQKLGIGDRLSLATRPMLDWNAAAGDAIGNWKMLRGEFMATPFGMVAGGIGTLALGAAGLAKDLAIAAVKAAALTLALGGLAAVGLTKMVVEMGAFAERSKRAFTFLTGSKALGGEAFETGRKLAQEFNLDVEDTVQSLIKLRSMQFTMPEAIELVKLSTDLQALSGDAEAAKRAITAITQIKAKGRLQSEELVGQLAEANVSTVLVYEQLEKSLHMSRKQVLAALQDGAIDAETGIAAIRKAILAKLKTKEAGAAGKAFATETLTGMWDGLMNAPKQLMLDISEYVDMSPITASIDKLMGSFKNIDRAMVGDFVSNMISGLAKALDAVIAFGEGFGSGFHEIAKVMGVTLNTDGVVEFSRKAGKWLAEFFAKAIGWGKTLFITIQDMWPMLEAGWALAKPALQTMLKIILSVVAAFDGAYNAAKMLYDILPGDKAVAAGSPPPLPAQGGATPITERYLGKGAAGSNSSVTVSRVEVHVDASGNADPSKVGEKTKQGLMDSFSSLGLRSAQ